MLDLMTHSWHIHETSLTSGHPPLYHGDNAGPPTALVWSARGAWVRVVRWDGGAHLLATVATVAPPQHVSVSPSGQGCDSLYDSLYDSLVTAYLALGVTLVSVKPSLSNLSRISDSRSMLNDNLETNVASLNSISSWQCLFYIFLKTRHIDL